MDAEKFSFYIKNPAHLYQITYTELKSLVLQHPYCQNLRYLLLKKSIQDKHPELDENLQLAATFSNDRDLLYRQIKDGDTFVSEADSFLLKEDYIELKALDTQTTDIDSIQKESYAPIDATFEQTETVDPITSITEAPKEIIPTTENLEKTTEILEKPEEEDVVLKANLLEDIDEEEFEDITDEMDELFDEDEGDDLEIVKPEPPPEKPSTELTKTVDERPDESSKPNEADDSISIEELIKLDTRSPLEREEAKVLKDLKEKDVEKKENEKAYDFEAIDALIEKTKKEVPLEIINEEELDINEKPAPAETPKEATFTSWLKQVQSGDTNEPEEKETLIKEERKKEESKKKKKKKKKKPKEKKKAKAKSDKVPKKAKVVARESLKENEEVYSETLANLLVKQENYKQAIKMYEKLSLIFPEKSSFFADQIKKLKNL